MNDSQRPFRVSGPPSPIPSLPTQPIYEITVANARKLDELATTQYGIPSIILMENAALALLKHTLELLESARNQSILIFAGPGNNAGDAFALARHLANLQLEPQIITTHPLAHYTNDAKINLDIIRTMNLPIHFVPDPYSPPYPGLIPGLIIDALFGTGLTRPITGIAREFIASINAMHRAGSLVLSIDVPSGLSAQTGLPIDPTNDDHDPKRNTVVIADRTVTLAALKVGLSAISAQPYIGDLFVEPIGLPHQLLKSLARPLSPPDDRRPR